MPLIVGLAILMQTLDATVAANALPSMAVALGETPVTLNLVLSAYLVGAAACLPISGWAADRFGARTVFLAAIAIFALGSLACGISANLGQLVAARLVQGCAGAMLMPVGRLVILRTASKAELISASTVLTVPALLGPVFGPALSGLVLSIASWRWVFLINVPAALLGLMLVARFIDNIREPDAPRLDWAGLMLSGLALIGLAVGLGGLGREDPPPAVSGGLALAGLAFGAAYAVYALRRPSPILDLTLLRGPVFRLTVLGGVFIRVILGAVPYLLALLLQVALGFSPLTAGLLTSATAIGALLMRTTAGPIVRRFGFKRLLAFNGVLTALSLAACALFGPATPQGVILAVLGLHGFLRSLQMTCLNAVAYADLAPEEMSGASTLVGVTQQVAQSFGIGLSASVVQALHQWHGGGPLGVAEVGPAFVAVAAVSLLAPPLFLRLPTDAGAELIARPEV